MSHNVFAVVLAGGSGSRFWPASRRVRPKQLQALSPGAGTLIEQTLRRVEPFCGTQQVMISTGAHLVEATRQVVPELALSAYLIEPQAKNTAPCIGWAAEKIARQDEDAIVVVLPSDHYIARPEEFSKALALAIDAAAAGVVVTLGIKPERAETGYGYLQAGEGASPGVVELKAFQEKPDAATAERYLTSGEYFWNAGIFVFPAGLMLRHFEACLPDTWQGLMRVRTAAEQGAVAEEQEVARFFSTVESVSIDYGVMEKIGKRGLVRMVPADVGWSDLGSFQTAWELADKDERGNSFAGDVVQVASKGNLVLDLGQGRHTTIALVGVEDLVVVRCDDAVLIAHREQCQDVKQIVGLLQAAGREDLL